MLLLTAAAIAAGCATDRARHFDGEITWKADDRHPIDKPDERWVPKYWDPADYILFRPVSHVWKFETAGPAANVNALGHVPNSSWFTNRLSRHQLSPERVARGPCERARMPREGEWVIRGGKIGGNNPGFQVEVRREDGSSTRYFMKFDGELQTERATGADVIDRLELGDDASKEDQLGRETPLTEADVRRAMKYAPRLKDGRVRAVTSKFLPGQPLGPFSYDGVRRDDPNDALPHEDRRELRGSRLLAAWLNHFDARQQNTYTSFISRGDSDRGYVQHFVIDFGDCLGSQWPSDAMTRRFGHSWYVDPAHLFTDLFTFGAIPRPWHRENSPPESTIFGYYDVAHFDPAAWKAGYPNIAFRRMDLRDAFWATNIISKFSDEHVRALVDTARFTRESYDRYLERVMIGRRDKIVETYFRKLSPLVKPVYRNGRVCVRDAWVARGYGPASSGFYDVRIAGSGGPTGDWRQLERAPGSDGELCVDVPPAKRFARRREDLVVSLRVRRPGQTQPARPARFHCRPQPDADRYRLVGILRVGDHP
ncbi:MAG: hypothetical protein ABEL76_14580 [Bradymonadaceae bacterium]